ncbi:hypothetical protein [Dethiothermospora halolimnae]|uniref:hypothetical protein n=1 Tax=Dethiothermospora halolimnae TaxID=3114390 RepID=UPI003CCBA470
MVFYYHFNKNDHSQYYYFSLTEEKHDIKIITEKANDELLTESEITKDKHWCYIHCWEKIKFDFEDEAFIFAKT